MRESRDVRIFFALWPDAATRAELARCARLMPVQRPARRVPDKNLHLTLHFVGNVYYAELDCLQRAARAVHGKRFELIIDRHGYFHKPRVAWLGLARLPAALRRLHGELGQRLQACGYRPETRAYNPHLTVARKMPRAAEMRDFEPVHWKVDNFVLIESRAGDNGVSYEVIETYALT